MVDLPTRNGLRLCSHRNPQGEAQSWVQGIQGPSTGVWIVLGIGAGYHLRALVEQHPNDDFLFVDFDSAMELNAPVGSRCRTKILSEKFDSNQFFNEFIVGRLKAGFRVLSFKASWAGLETSFQRLESLSLGRHGECNSLLSADAGLKKAFFNVPANVEINIKTLTETEPVPSTLRWKRLRALRELVS